jgi:uncharacterized coiled-coil protein SlyX
VTESEAEIPRELIESKIAFLEQATSELSEVIVRQQEEIRVLEAKVARLSELLEAIKEAPPYGAESEKPPHY